MAKPGKKTEEDLAKEKAAVEEELRKQEEAVKAQRREEEAAIEELLRRGQDEEEAMPAEPEREELEPLPQQLERDLLQPQLPEQPKPIVEPKLAVPVTYKLEKPASDSHWPSIVDDFKAVYEKEPEPNGALAFDTADSANAFFTAQAQASREFLCVKMENGQATNEHMFSCGTGKLYNGSLQDIQASLRKDLEADPTNAKLKSGATQIEARIAAVKASAGVRDQLGQLKEQIKEQQKAEQPKSEPKKEEQQEPPQQAGPP